MFFCRLFFSAEKKHSWWEITSSWRLFCWYCWKECRILVTFRSVFFWCLWKNLQIEKTYSGKMQGSATKGVVFSLVLPKKEVASSTDGKIVCCWANESKDFPGLDGGNPLISPFFLSISDIFPFKHCQEGIGRQKFTPTFKCFFAATCWRCPRKRSWIWEEAAAQHWVASRFEFIALFRISGESGDFQVSQPHIIFR